LQRGDNTNLGLDIDLHLLFSDPSVEMREQRQGSFTVAFQRCGA
jgi:hypothetical protein